MAFPFFMVSCFCAHSAGIIGLASSHMNDQKPLMQMVLAGKLYIIKYK
jgi:hypothetical protein